MPVIASRIAKAPQPANSFVIVLENSVSLTERSLIGSGIVRRYRRIDSSECLVHGTARCRFVTEVADDRTADGQDHCGIGM